MFTCLTYPMKDDEVINEGRIRICQKIFMALEVMFISRLVSSVQILFQFCPLDYTSAFFLLFIAPSPEKVTKYPKV